MAFSQNLSGYPRSNGRFTRGALVFKDLKKLPSLPGRVEIAAGDDGVVLSLLAASALFVYFLCDSWFQS